MKSILESSTIWSALSAFALAVSPVLLEAIEEKRNPTDAELAWIASALLALGATIRGRVKATEAIEFTIPGVSNSSVDSTIDDKEEINFVYDPNARYQLKVNKDSLLKLSPLDSTRLPPDHVFDLPQGKYTIEAYKSLPGLNHTLVTISGQEYFVWNGDTELINTQNKPVTSNRDPAQPKNAAEAFKIPGFSSVFYLGDPIVPGSNFTWAEATKNGSRLPESKDIAENIMRVTDRLQQLREYIGNKPLIPTSWYRPPAVNRAVRGASNSQHLTGGAVDFYGVGIDIWELQDRVIQFWHGGIGKGAGYKDFVHVDIRPDRIIWNY